MADDKLRTVYMVEVLETPEHDGKIELWGLPEDAKTSAKAWRDKGRQARTWPESVLWS